jgi:hypothetical protein
MQEFMHGFVEFDVKVVSLPWVRVNKDRVELFLPSSGAYKDNA